MSEFTVLESIAAVSGKKDKRKLLEDNKDNKKLEELCNASLNFFRKFYMHKFDISAINPNAEDKHNEFMALLIKLEKREITGHAAKAEVESLLNGCNEQQQLWYSRVLRKDLKAGFSVNTASKYFDIPVFDVMLATDGKKCKKINEIISKGVWSSPKLDGYRCLAYIDYGEVTLFSRNGSVYKNFPKIEAGLSRIFKDQKVILDGEIMSDDFQSMQQTAFSSKSGKSVGDVTYHVFDYIPFSEWESNEFKMSKSRRYEVLAGEIFDQIVLFEEDVKGIELVQQELVTSIERVLELEQEYMAVGYEGVMIVPDIPYYKGRKSNKLMKFKTMLSQDCIIVGHYLGEIGTRLEGKLGGFIVQQENGEICKVGTGFSDEDREQYMLAPDTWYNKCMETKYQELTNDGIMRFPVFMRWRYEKNAL